MLALCTFERALVRSREIPEGISVKAGRRRLNVYWVQTTQALILIRDRNSQSYSRRIRNRILEPFNWRTAFGWRWRAARRLIVLRLKQNIES